MSQGSKIGFSILISVLVLSAQTGFWYNQYVINPTNFTQTLKSGLLTDESKKAFSSEIVDKGLEIRPLAREVFGETGEAAIYSLMGTNFFQATIDRLSKRVHTQLTTPEKTDLSIDVARLKQVVVPIIQRINPDAGKNLEREIPDRIVILRPDIIPSLYEEGSIILWASWISFVALIPLVIYYFISNKILPSSLKILGTTLLISSIFLIVAIITVAPLFLTRIESSNVHVIAENISQAFLSTFTSQTMWVGLLGVMLIMGGYIYDPVKKRIVAQTGKK